MGKKILYVDMDNVLVDFPSGLRHYGAEVLHAYAGRFDEIPGIFANMEAVAGAIPAFTLLSQYFDTYILSTSPWENPSAWSDKLLWVKAHLGPYAYKRLILTHHKHLNSGDYLIDDRPNNGADRFTGELLLFGTARFPDWQAVVAYLIPERA
jgi:5'(3')-deoxyribonucleotidase